VLHADSSVCAWDHRVTVRHGEEPMAANTGSFVK
jgi:hypothetical protein